MVYFIKNNRINKVSFKVFSIYQDKSLMSEVLLRGFSFLRMKSYNDYDRIYIPLMSLLIRCLRKLAFSAKGISATGNWWIPAVTVIYMA